MFLLQPDNIWKSGRMAQIAKEQVIVIVIVIARIGHSPWGFSGPILQCFLRLLGEIGRQLI